MIGSMEQEKSFSQIVYEIIALIPKGRVTTYGAIAAAMGRPRAARFVGYAMSNCPEQLPWYRVVNRKGELIKGWEQLHRSLLEADGVPFLENGNIDMKKCFFMPNEM
ncbi:MGMT family protein [Ruminococcus sp. Marseille-P6503]|uniref:MGMT family protein n=1 Tax=Ruminococcus sp. Marseille-P6503 TaxID=2364796 RepID=UPI001FAA40FE|nr:MGMT family protein [Ruminococcus sp. Marseille-P6503]